MTKNPRTGVVEVDPDRTSTNANVARAEVPSIVERLVALGACDERQLETLQVLRYTEGQVCREPKRNARCQATGNAAAPPRHRTTAPPHHRATAPPRHRTTVPARHPNPMNSPHELTVTLRPVDELRLRLPALSSPHRRLRRACVGMRLHRIWKAGHYFHIPQRCWSRGRDAFQPARD